MTGRQRETQGDFGTELRRWRSKRELSLAGPVTIPAQATVDQCPYRGLAAFGPGDARWFFGRERATAEVIARVTERLDDPGPVLVVGPSGVGKSSLLRAGLVPALARGVLPVPGSRDWPVVVLTPTEDPLGELDRRATPGAVLVVDQFEEVFTLCPDEETRARFIAAVCARDLVVLLGHTDQSQTTDISPDGTQFVTSGADGTHRLWTLTDPPTERAILTPGQSSAIFASDSRTLLTAGDSVIRAWDTNVDAVAKRICDHAGAPITKDEWARYFDTPCRPPCRTQP
jgi:hypothetical protein